MELTGQCTQCGSDGVFVDGVWARTQRVAAGVTATMMAKRLGYTRQYIHMLEGNRQRFSRGIWDRYAAVLAETAV